MAWRDGRGTFANRTEAGRALAEILAAMPLPQPVVYALPRGGIVPAAEIARALKAPLDVVLVRKIGVPSQPELAMGAIVDGDEAIIERNEAVIASAGITEEMFEGKAARERAEIERRRQLWFGGRAPIAVKGRTAIIVDDGVATGATARAAIRALRRRGAARIVLAVPVGPLEEIAALEPLVDDLVCLEQAQFFAGVGGFYRDFAQVTDEEVTALLAASATATGATQLRLDCR